MRWLRHRKARLDRDAGLVFAWRGMSPGWRRQASAVLVVILLGVLLAVSVRVRVVPPLPVARRPGTLMVAGNRESLGFLSGRLEEASPFPSRYEVREMAATERALAEATRMECGGDYRPRLRELPDGGEDRDLPPLPAGWRDLPPLPRPGEAMAGVVAKRLRAELVPDSVDLASRVITPVPKLEAAEGSGAVAGSSARYLVEVRRDGGVGVVVPLAGGTGGNGFAGVGAWLGRLRFEAAEEMAGWQALEVRWVPDHD